MAQYIKYKWWDDCSTELAHRTGFTPSCRKCEVEDPVEITVGGSEDGKEEDDAKTQCSETSAVATKRPFNTYLLNLALDTVIGLPYTYDPVIPRANSSYHGFVQVNGLCKGQESLAVLIEETYSSAYERALEIISNDCINNEDHSDTVLQTVSDEMEATMQICQFVYLRKVIYDGIVAGAQDAYTTFYGVQYDAQYQESTDYINLLLHAGEIDSDSLSAVYRLADLAVDEAQNFITADVALLAAMANAAKKAWYDITKEFFDERTPLPEDAEFYAQQLQQLNNGGLLSGQQRNDQQDDRDDYKKSGSGIDNVPQLDTWDATKFDKSNPIDFVDWSGFRGDTPTTAGMGTMFLQMGAIAVNRIIVSITREYRYRI